ncbi:hypothetical protein [Sphingomonas faeni]|uniref:hypothetical protein n=1 Tax=Sphingomonas faeni TaxID=185950 RepID=UPI0020C157A7|nr:hypothetical protein [Sphingomonas faeni]MCK8455162.1 hypothetical protein [Sphingomonas faeni]
MAEDDREVCRIEPQFHTQVDDHDPSVQSVAKAGFDEGAGAIVLVGNACAEQGAQASVKDGLMKPVRNDRDGELASLSLKVGR